jgi:ribosome-associated translation inhibitor RaiA
VGRDAYGLIAARGSVARSLPPYYVRLMKIAIHTHEPITPQARGYIEYRMFSAIGRFGRKCVHLSVRLDSTEVGSRHCCALALDLKPAGHVRARATADHLYAAVDQSAQRLSRGVERLLQPRSREPNHKRRK